MSSGTAVILKLGTLHSLESYIKSCKHLSTDLVLSSTICKSLLESQYQECHKMWTKKERSSARWERDLDVKKRKYHEDTEKKRQAVEMRYHDKKESIKQYKKQKYLENQTPNSRY